MPTVRGVGMALSLRPPRSSSAWSTLSTPPAEIQWRTAEGQSGPEIWLSDERDELLARRLIETARRGPARGAALWKCAQCHEMLEAQFTVCWQCGTARDPLAD